MTIVYETEDGEIVEQAREKIRCDGCGDVHSTYETAEIEIRGEAVMQVCGDCILEGVEIGGEDAYIETKEVAKFGNPRDKSKLDYVHLNLPNGGDMKAITNPLTQSNQE